jgi:hypothetical protein
MTDTSVPLPIKEPDGYKLIAYPKDSRLGFADPFQRAPN